MWELRGVQRKHCAEGLAQFVALEQQLVVLARLERDDTYHGAHDTYFVPSGYPRYAASVLNTGNFNCFSNGTCKF